MNNSSHKNVENYDLQSRNKYNDPNVVNNLLVYPLSFSHQFSTLTLEQHNYLLQQQKQLLLSINANNFNVAQQQQQQALNQYYYNQQQLQKESYQKMLNQNAM